MAWTTYAFSVPLLLPLLWLYLVTPRPPPPALTDKTITLLIAHPDDEAMFFAPTLLSLTPYNSVRVLCLSTGDADGLGSIRSGELVSSCRALGVRADAGTDVVAVVDDAATLPDSMSTAWPVEAIVRYLRQHAADSDAILTFDAGGVSGHPNHISLLYGAREFADRTGKALYTLTSVSLLRKYLSVFDVPLTMALAGEDGRRLVSVSSAAQVRITQKAMTDSHKSQMRWFRWGWIGLSRYMVVNDLREENAPQ